MVFKLHLNFPSNRRAVFSHRHQLPPYGDHLLSLSLSSSSSSPPVASERDSRYADRMGGSGWRKAIRGFNLCVHSPLATEGSGDVGPPAASYDPSAALSSPDPPASQPPIPTQSSSGLRPRVSASGSGLSKVE